MKTLFIISIIFLVSVFSTSKTDPFSAKSSVERAITGDAILVNASQSPMLGLHETSLAVDISFDSSTYSEHYAGLRGSLSSDIQMLCYELKTDGLALTQDQDVFFKKYCH